MAGRRLSPLDERVDVPGPLGVQEHVALADARLLRQEPGGEQSLAHRLGQSAVVAGEAARQVGELGVVAAPLAHAVQALQDAPRHTAGGVGVVVGSRRPHGGVERGEDGLLVLLHRRRVGRVPAQGRDAGGHHQRVRGADRVAQVVDLGEHARRQHQGARPQAVDALDVVLEGERHELGVVGVAGHLQGQVAAERAHPQRARAGDLHERAHERGDQQPRALVDGVGVRAQRGPRGRHGAQRPLGGAHGDDHGPLVARALAHELAGATLELGLQQRAQPRRSGEVALPGEHRREIVHDHRNATQASSSVRWHP